MTSVQIPPVGITAKLEDLDYSTEMKVQYSLSMYTFKQSHQSTTLYMHPNAYLVFH